MADSAELRRLGGVFDAVADQYDRHRPTYPDGLVNRACNAAGLEAGDPVLEVGCGSGQLTQSLLARGLRVSAVEPGESLIWHARQRLAGAGEVSFLHARLEEAPVPRGHFRAAFAASAIHWVDPDLGWQKLADALIEGGSLALLAFFGVDDALSRSDQSALRDRLRSVAPGLADQWPTYRDLAALSAGAGERDDNISQVWAWLGGHDVARSYVSELFAMTQLTVMPIELKHTADELSALLGTMSFWSRLSPEQRDVLECDIRSLQERLGRPLRSNIAACLVTAKRRGGAAAVS